MLFFSLILIFLFSGCGKKTAPSDVDFSVERDVQISYNNVIVNSIVSFDGESLFLVLKNISGNNDDAFVRISTNEYSIEYCDMLFSGETDELTDSFLPNIIYSFFKTNGNVLTFNGYAEDDSKIFEATTLNHFIEIELFSKNNETPFFSFYIA